MQDVTQEAMKHDKAMEERYEDKSPIDVCRQLAAYEFGVSFESTYVVMFAFTLGSYKAFCSSSQVHEDKGQYVEVVFNADKNQHYVVKYRETDRKTV